MAKKKTPKLDVMKVVLAPLYELGNSSKAIAKELKKRNIKGYHDQTSCPLANVLKKHYKHDIEVDDEHIEINGVRIDISDTVFSKFVNDFDSVQQGGDNYGNKTYQLYWDLEA